MRAGVGSSRRDVAKGGKRCIKKTERERERDGEGEGEKNARKMYPAHGPCSTDEFVALSSLSALT